MAVANYPMSFDSGTKILKVWGNSTNASYDYMGYDADNPITFDHIKEYAIYLALGIAEEDGYIFDFRIDIYTNSSYGGQTYFIDTNKQIYFKRTGLASDVYTIYAESGTHFELGEVVSSTLKTSRNGCDIYIDGNVGYSGGIKVAGYGGIYSSTLKILSPASGSSVIHDGAAGVCFWNNSFINGGIRGCNANTDFYNISVEGAGLALYYALGVFDKMEFYNCTDIAQIRRESLSVVASNCVAKNCTNLVRLYGNNPADGYLDLTNSNIEDWTTYTGSMTVGTTNYVYRRYTLKVIVKDENGDIIPSANILLKNLQGTTIFDGTTDVNGLIEEIILVNQWTYTNPSGTIQRESIDYNPFTISISKDGYENYEGQVLIENITSLSITLKSILKIRKTIDGKLLLATNPENGSNSNMIEI